MADAPFLLAMAFAASLLGFAWIALAMRSHWIQVHGGGGPARAVQAALRALGIAALAASLALSVGAGPLSMGILVWMMLLAAAAMLVALVLQGWPGALRVLWPTRGSNGSRSAK